MCQKFYGILNIFEVVLRNSINNHYTTVFGEDWILSQLGCKGMLNDFPRKEEIKRQIISLKRDNKYTNDRLVSSVTFGFWTHLFTKHPFRQGGQTLLKIFPRKELGLGQKALFKELMQVKSFRNRIAHHEAIIFDKDSNIDMSAVRLHYDQILKIIFYLGFDTKELFYGIDVMPDSLILKIEELKRSV